MPTTTLTTALAEHQAWLTGMYHTQQHTGAWTTGRAPASLSLFAPSIGFEGTSDDVSGIFDTALTIGAAEDLVNLDDDLPVYRSMSMFVFEDNPSVVLEDELVYRSLGDMLGSSSPTASGSPTEEEVDCLMPPLVRRQNAW